MAAVPIGFTLAPLPVGADRGAHAQHAPAPSVQDVQRHPCSSATSRCEGEIQVPLDWSVPDSERITVAFVWVPRADTTRPATGTILANFGGPAAGIPYAPILEEALGPVLERRNLLVVDPRGLGESSPLLCPGLDLYDDGAIAACAEALGLRVQYFTTDQIVADMDAVRAALGVDKVSFYGNSYGTVYAHAYATRFPGHTEAVFFDSVVRIDTDGYVREPIHSGAEHIELVCSRSPACAALPGTPTGTLERLVETLRSDPDPEVPIGALRTLRQGANLVAAREGTAAAVAYFTGDPAPLRRLTRTFRADSPFELKGADLAGMLAVRCGDSRFPYDRSASPEERRRQLDRFFSVEKPLAPFEVSDLPGFRPPAAECVHWPTPRESPPVPPGATFPPVPVLAVAGDFDTEAPADVAEQIARFPSSTVVPVRYGTHALAAGRAKPYQGCVRALMRAFLADPGTPVRPPDEPGGCDGESFRAVGTFPRTVADVPAAVSDELSDQERQFVAAAFATVADAVARRNPSDVVSRPANERGLRGGELRWDRATRTIRLEEVRFVDDLVLTGTIDLDPEHRATAELRAVGRAGRTRELILRWRAFVAANRTEVTGSLDGSPFTAWIPLH